eukprot:CAMPEP_0202342968 /NCGR_PEP_ID=MMETSP1126-20121109/3302_1 /ASSEMBLY_ACC=CAM_ASM_000457 /TAXON_ID=3047 /ORGANISM="Dunaliella tertiolecta, Strain CCMP1320" /LENGTH=75 /DNA_ID=CAMNT_0048933993 /DNA_START=1012 /DNA_END=1239 /DNA_ORIENTATION=+
MGLYASGPGFLSASEGGLSFGPMVTGGLLGRCLSFEAPASYAPGPGVLSGLCLPAFLDLKLYALADGRTGATEGA